MTAEIEVLESVKKIEDCGRIAAEGQERQKAKVKTLMKATTVLLHMRESRERQQLQQTNKRKCSFVEDVS